MSTILVTGGAGYIGSHTCKALHAAGHTPVVYDNLSNGHRNAVRWGPFEQGDITDRDRLRDVLAAHRPEAVIHFAGLIEVGHSVRDPGSFWHANVVGTWKLLAAMRDAGVGRIVFSSTAAVYGIPDTVPIPEDAPTVPVNPYGDTKRAVETMLANHAAADGLRYAALRYFNAAGADPDGELGERHDPETHLVPLVLQVALGQRDEIAVFGNDYPTPDGTAVRDYVHVADLAAAHVAAVAHLDANEAPLVANLGTGTGYSVREIIETCRAVTGHAIPHRDAARRAGDPPQLVAAADRAKDALGWTPANSDLETIVASAWRWHSENPVP
ncbi:MAG: UDP-glucose 4-epimerase GalE [Alphaproteobacteria bacterium]|nr:UDP-glucose 4-epimerase GalE [Alphaproteobacteria bacterium]